MSNFKLRRLSSRLLAVTLAVLLTVSLVPMNAVPAEADTVVGANFTELKTLVDNTADGGTLKLERSFTGASGDPEIVINKKMTLDLNGATIDRNNKTIDTFTLEENGELTVIDSAGMSDIGVIKGGHSGIYVKSGAKLTFKEGNINANHHGIITYGTTSIEGGKITGNDSSGQTTNYGRGGGLLVEEGTTTMSGGEISGNRGTPGAGVAVWEGASFTMTGGKITGNTSVNEGGGIYSPYGTVNINGGEISGNKAVSGGGVFVCRGTTINFSAGTISGNSATNGGGVYVEQTGAFSMTGGTVKDNTAAETGGGVFAEEPYTVNDGEYVIYEAGKFQLQGGVVSGNTAATANAANRADFSKMPVNSALKAGAAIDGALSTLISDFNALTDEQVSGFGFMAVALGANEFGTFTELQQLIDETQDGGTLTLEKDYRYNSSQAGETCIKIAKNITLDLNGHTLDRRLGDSEDAPDDGCVIELASGQLIVQDNYGGGTITGGRCWEGGGIKADRWCYGTLVLQGGTITGNYGRGAISTEFGCEFWMSGGNVVGNDGGAALNLEGCIVWISGGTISGQTNGDAIFCNGDMWFSGGTISNSSAPLFKWSNRLGLMFRAPNGSWEMSLAPEAPSKLSNDYDENLTFMVSESEDGSGAVEISAKDLYENENYKKYKYIHGDPFVPEPQKWNVVFDTLGGSKVETQQVLDGETAVKPKDPTIKFGTFAGWYLDKDYTTAWNPSTPVTAGLTVYAKWEFHLEQFEYIDANGEKKTAQCHPLLDGYTEWTDGCWYIAPDAESTTISERIEIAELGTVNLILRDGTSLIAAHGIHVPQGSTLNIYRQEEGTGGLKANGIYKHETENWDVHNAGIGANEGEDSFGTINIYCANVTGIGSPGISCRPSYGTLNVAGDLFLMAGDTVENSDLSEIYASPDKMWVLSEEGMQYGGSKAMMTTLPSYTIFFNGEINGNTDHSSMKCTYTTSAGTTTEDMELDGSFWRLTVEKEPTKVKFTSGSGSSTSTSNVEEIANPIESINYTNIVAGSKGFFVMYGSAMVAVIQYNNGSGSNAGKSPTVLRVPEGGILPEPKTPVHTDPSYAFQRWESNGYEKGADGLSRYVGKAHDFTLPITESIIIDAIWEKTDYTVSFDVGESTGSAAPQSQTVGRTNKAVEPEKPVWGSTDGISRVFKYWETAEDVHTIDILNNPVFLPEGTRYNFNTMVTSNVKLRAVWVHEHKYERHKLTDYIDDSVQNAELINSFHVAVCTECGYTLYEAHDYKKAERDTRCTVCQWKKPDATHVLRVLYRRIDDDGKEAYVYAHATDKMYMKNEDKIVGDGEKVTLYAPEVEGMKFSCWKINDYGVGLTQPSTTVLSYETSVTLSIGRNAYVYAVYEQDPENTMIYMRTSTYQNGDSHVRLDLQWRLPEGSTVESAGFLSTTNYGLGYRSYGFLESRGKPKTDNLLDIRIYKYDPVLQPYTLKYSSDEIAMRMLYGYSLDTSLKADVLSMPAKNPGRTGAYAALCPLNNVEGEGPYLYVMGYVNYTNGTKDDNGELKTYRLITGPVALTRAAQVTESSSHDPVDNY